MRREMSLPYFASQMGTNFSSFALYRLDNNRMWLKICCVRQPLIGRVSGTR
uniref:Uncharacterized protein n=1 Tax=Anguilla anguilla TaxID=7936 RepID=A0A0E9T6W3_ANGAN